MSAKPNSLISNDDVGSDFVLKHRIAGAGFLLLFGALFLPWLLGAPSVASKLPGYDKVPTSDHTQVSSQPAPQIDQDLGSAIAEEQLPITEKVYISKITPLDTGSKPTNPDFSDTVEKPVLKTSSKTIQADLVQTRKTQKQAEQLAKLTLQKLENGTGSNSADAPKNEVGWAVQVGVFTDKLGAARVVSDLKAKGFNPSTSTVDTNRGKATGTRIWLGPFAQRVDAAKAKTLLTDKTGEAGFIRSYP